MAVGQEDRVVAVPLGRRAAARRYVPARGPRTPPRRRPARPAPGCSRTAPGRARGSPVAAISRQARAIATAEVAAAAASRPSPRCGRRARRRARRSAAPNRRPAPAATVASIAALRLDPRRCRRRSSSVSSGSGSPKSAFDVSVTPSAVEQSRDLFELAAIVGGDEQRRPIQPRVSGRLTPPPRAAPRPAAPPPPRPGPEACPSRRG